MGLLDMFGSGGGGGMGAMVQNFIMGQMKDPKTQKMISDKVGEMYAHLAEQFKCKKEDVGIFAKLEAVTVKEGDVIKLGEDGQPMKEEKLVLYVYVEGKAVQKILIDQFLSMMTAGETANQ